MRSSGSRTEVRDRDGLRTGLRADWVSEVGSQAAEERDHHLDDDDRQQEHHQDDAQLDDGHLAVLRVGDSPDGVHC